MVIALMTLCCYNLGGWVPEHLASAGCATQGDGVMAHGC